METEVESGATLTFERFWKWLHAHKTCIIRAGASDTFLYDDEDLHWQLEEDPDRSPVVQLCRGKQILGEVEIDLRDILFVQATPAPEDNPSYVLFEAIGGPKEEPYALYHFLLAHGFEEEEPVHRNVWKH
jgi:hypothetical protein